MSIVSVLVIHKYESYKMMFKNILQRERELGSSDSRVNCSRQWADRHCKKGASTTVCVANFTEATAIVFLITDYWTNICTKHNGRYEIGTLAFYWEATFDIAKDRIRRIGGVSIQWPRLFTVLNVIQPAMNGHDTSHHTALYYCPTVMCPLLEG